MSTAALPARGRDEHPEVAVATRLSFTLNEDEVEVHLPDPSVPLLEVLRDGLGLTGTKSGCGIGYCGACTVLVDGAAVPSCLTVAALVEGARVRTVEGLRGPDGLDAVQAGFVARSGMQCGFCTPGHVMGLRALLEEDPDPGEERLREVVDGTYCRCTGYVKILDAAREAVALLRRGAAERGGA
jgi:aerobic-type carbon monoxide dehydrogenase small subunit (CoxS/CutS family)